MHLGSGDSTLIYHSARQGWKLRCLLFAILAFTGAMTWLAWDIFSSLGLNPADGYGGVLAPLTHRLLGSIVVVALGLVVLIGMELFRRRYAGQIFLRETELALNIVHVGWFGWSVREVKLSDIDRVEHFEGLALNGAGYPATPFLALYIEGFWVPLIIDLQGKVVETRLFKKFFPLISG